MLTSKVLLVSLCALVCLFAHVIGSRYRNVEECEENPVMVWRNDNLTCQPRAVCADVFNTVRNWYGQNNGRPPCREHRVIHNCRCPTGNNGETTECPFENPDNLLMSSRRHRMYTCQPACTLPYCSNVDLEDVTTSMRMVHNDPLFGDMNYYRMECRCPRHHIPSSLPGVQRAAYAFSSIYNIRIHQFHTLYRCQNIGNENFMDDPCQYTQN